MTDPKDARDIVGDLTDAELDRILTGADWVVHGD